ncbi:MAG: hypothetical protein WCK64_00875 [Synechococcaceae cyanobacterium ELA445]
MNPIALSLALLGLALVASPCRSADLERVPLRCRLDQGPWKPCVMTVSQVGQLWSLELAGESFAFRHDGRGQVTMRRGQASPRVVNARWLADQTLCWDGVCAQGALPLD